MYLLLPSSLDGVLNPGTRMGSFILIFIEKTLSGVPFSFTAKMKDGKIGNLVKEIESFVDAIDRKFVPRNG